jgi:hypothetical protein
MIRSDHTKISFEFLDRLQDRPKMEIINGYKEWFINHNIKYSFDRFPPWSPCPTSVILRKEDALLFKLTFGL